MRATARISLPRVFQLVATGNPWYDLSLRQDCGQPVDVIDLGGAGVQAGDTQVATIVEQASAKQDQISKRGRRRIARSAQIEHDCLGKPVAQCHSFNTSGIDVLEMLAGNNDGKFLN